MTGGIACCDGIGGIIGGGTGGGGVAGPLLPETSLGALGGTRFVGTADGPVSITFGKGGAGENEGGVGALGFTNDCDAEGPKSLLGVGMLGWSGCGDVT